MSDDWHIHPNFLPIDNLQTEHSEGEPEQMTTVSMSRIDKYESLRMLR